MQYDHEELRGDLHHLIQPIIGMMRLQQTQPHPASFTSYAIKRLRLALALLDMKEPTDEIRKARSETGCGAFSAER